MGGWLSKSGGLLYHFKSLRFQKSLWLPFRKELEAFFLKQTEKLSPSQKEHLILVGGSGGHCLPNSFLQNFKEIHLVDLDPLAPRFFKWRHPQLNLRFQYQDIFDLNGSVDEKLLQKFRPQNSTWVWCNLLGQLGFSLTVSEVEKRLSSVKTSMENFAWFSFHDLYSLTSTQNFSTLPLKRSYKDWSSAEKDLSALFHFRLELRDHLTGEFLSSSQSETRPEKQVMVWPLTPFEIHFVECGFTSSSPFSPSR